MTTPPQAFSDLSRLSPPQPQGAVGESAAVVADLSILPESLLDLPTPIRDKIDALVHNDQDLGTQLSVIDALMLGKFY